MPNLISNIILFFLQNLVNYSQMSAFLYEFMYLILSNAQAFFSDFSSTYILLIMTTNYAIFCALTITILLAFAKNHYLPFYVYFFVCNLIFKSLFSPIAKLEIYHKRCHRYQHTYLTNRYILG